MHFGKFLTFLDSTTCRFLHDIFERLNEHSNDVSTYHFKTGKGVTEPFGAC